MRRLVLLLLALAGCQADRSPWGRDYEFSRSDINRAIVVALGLSNVQSPFCLTVDRRPPSRELTLRLEHAGLRPGRCRAGEIIHRVAATKRGRYLVVGHFADEGVLNGGWSYTTTFRRNADGDVVVVRHSRGPVEG